MLIHVLRFCVFHSETPGCFGRKALRQVSTFAIFKLCYVILISEIREKLQRTSKFQFDIRLLTDRPVSLLLKKKEERLDNNDINSIR